MDVYEITGYRTGIDNAGVNFLDPVDAFENLRNGFVYRQVLQSRLGFVQFANRLSDESRVMGIFENVLPDSSTELLVISKEFLYRYNNGTNQFDQVPMAGAAPPGGFGITDDKDYVSGTTYLTRTGSQRFVFTGKGMSAVYFYDGTDVKVFTNAADNPDYQQPAAAIGNLVRATIVSWFGERLNFFVPVTTVATYNQGVLYSGIRDASGSGDQFNVPGAGLLEADTYELMKSAIRLGDQMVMNFQRSRWVLQKTRDAFNPYITKKIPSVLGTDAGFSAVNWNYEVKSVGKTGFVSTDGRQDLRFDNKIPYFSADNISQEFFELTYGGFDRINGQFLFSYRDANSNLDTDTQDKVLVYNYEESSWSVNDQRFSVFGQTDQGQNIVWNDIDETLQASWARWDTTEEVWNKIGVSEATQKTLAGDNLGFVYQINVDFDDYFVAISNISQATAAVLTIDSSAFQVGDRVYIDNVTGMTEINGLTANVLSRTDTSITVDIDSTNFTAYSADGSVSKLIQFEAIMNPFNPYRDQGRRIYMSHVEFLIDTNGGDLYVDFYIDEEESPFKTSMLVSPTTTTKQRVWINNAVNQEANFIRMVLRNESAGKQTKITSIRMHCNPGGYTSS